MGAQHSHCSYCGQPFPPGAGWPRVCPACGEITYRNPLPVAVGLVPVDDGLLVVRRGIEPARGQLALPGGYINYGESWQAACAREVQEETGVRLDPAAITEFSVASTPNGASIIVFGLAAPLRRAELPPFQLDAETLEALVINQAQALAFTLHTAAMAAYFPRPAQPGVTRGLVIGKFLPPHAGHLRLCALAAAQVDVLHVILFSKAQEPIPGALRLAWLRELLPAVALAHITADHIVNFDDPLAWDYWISAIRGVLPADPEVVFSSEPYGAELARRLGARHVSVDPARAAVPISASQIRAAPLAHWPFIPPPVRPYYARRVAVVGAECTGKTTLAQALAEHFQTVWAPEYARDYLRGRAQPCTRADLDRIADGQAAATEAQARRANRLLICDTDLLTTQLWHEHYFGDCPPELRRRARQQPADLTLLCDTAVPWVADGLRDAPAHRGWFHSRFEAELATQGRRYVVLRGALAERMRTAIPLVAQLLPAEAETAQASSSTASLALGAE